MDASSIIYYVGGAGGVTEREKNFLKRACFIKDGQGRHKKPRYRGMYQGYALYILYAFSVGMAVIIPLCLQQKGGFLSRKPP